MTSAYLVVNAGSSSLKFALYPHDTEASLCHGKITGIGEATIQPQHFGLPLALAWPRTARLRHAISEVRHLHETEP